MAQLAQRIGGQLGVPVHDETNLTGEYDFKLNFALDDSGPSMFSAVQDQLGLKLESGKGPVRTLVIERAWATLLLMAASIGFAVSAGVVLGAGSGVVAGAFVQCICSHC